MVAAVSLLFFVAAAFANANTSPSGDRPPATQATRSVIAAVTSRRDHVGPVVIPAALQNITRCMVNTARAAPDVISAEWAVFSQNGEADIHVRYQYRIGDGGTGASDYSAQLDTIRETLNAPNTTRPIVRF